MRKEWMEPVIEVQEFVANEYVASCGVSGKVYKFECNAGDKNLYLIYPYNVYVDSNHNDIWDEGDEKLGSYHACGAAHEAPVRDDFLTGFMKDTRLRRDQSPVPVVIWRGEDGNNIHCTTNLDINSWATAKS